MFELLPPDKNRASKQNHRNDVPRLMSAADIYAMPSDGEPFGLVFVEAMAVGLPVVALNNGGTP